MEHPRLHATGLVTRNSLAYVSTVFRFYRERRLFVPVAAQEAVSSHPGIQFEAVHDPGAGGGWFNERHEPQHGTDFAQINFTSGSTGKPKSILLSYDALAYTAAQLVEVMQLSADISEYVAVPPTYSFGLGRFRACAAAGGRAYLPARGFSPAEIERMLRAGDINALSAVPTMIRVLLQHADLFHHSGERMRWVEIGSQHLTRAEKEGVKALFPNAKIIQHYGLTEASRTTFLDISQTEGRFLESVGRPLGETQVAVADDGRIRISGPHVAHEWIADRHVPSPLAPDGWLTTNDLGSIEDGYLFYGGRADELINCGGVKLVPELIEERIRARLDGMQNFAVARMADPILGDAVLIAAERSTAKLDQLGAVATQVLAEFGVAAASSLQVSAIDIIPTTATGKVQRQALADAVAATAPDIFSRAQIVSGTMHGHVPDAFRRAFPRAAITSGDSFDSLGGDSLAHVSITALLDGDARGLPEDWEGLPIAELQALLSPPKSKLSLFSLRQINSAIMLRALAISMIVIHHAIYIDVGGGVDVLLLLVGLNLARFQTGRLTSASRWDMVRDAVPRILLPYYVIITAYSLWRRPSIVSWGDYLLISNFQGRIDLFITPYWFIAGYFQLLLVLVALSYVPQINKLIADQPARFGAWFLSLALVIKVAALLIFHHQALVGRTPDQFLYIMALGWCIHAARSTASRCALVAITLAIAAMGMIGPTAYWSGFDGHWHELALAGAVLILLFVPNFTLSNLVRTIVVEVALASFMIYLTHSLVLPLCYQAKLNHWVAVVVSLALGVGLSRGLNLALSRAARMTTGPQRPEYSL